MSTTPAAIGKARAAAMRALRENHAEEYDDLVRRERVARGLSAEPVRDRLETLLERATGLERQLLEIRAQAEQERIVLETKLGYAVVS